MKQQQFEEANARFWEEFGRRAEALPRAREQVAGEAESFLADYRRLCHHLSLARSRGYSTGLVERLNHLMLKGHWLLYRHRRMRFGDLLVFLRQRFPQTVRDHWRLVLVASLLFYGAALVMALLVAFVPESLHYILDAQEVNSLEAMYDPAGEHYGRVREDATDVQMFGFYIRNNIGIGLQTVASGLLFGLGSVFFLVLNGLNLGAAAAHLQGIGFGEPFWTFVVAHGAFELTAITLAGAAGLHLGDALLAPGERSRRRALREHAVQIVPLLYGVVILLVVAAVIEAFWSSKPLPVAWKYAVGAACWVAVGGYLLLCGRERSGSRPAAPYSGAGAVSLPARGAAAAREGAKDAT